MEKILTVVIPAYNVEKYLNKTINSFLEDSILQDIEILIINDGSKDGTAKIGSEMEEKYQGTIKLINKENGGHGSTINKGIELATGKFFKVVDGDDWVDTSEFVKMVVRLKSENADAVLMPFKKVHIDSNDEEIISMPASECENSIEFNKIAGKLQNSLQIHSVIYKTEILKQIPAITENCFYVDQEFCLYPIKYVRTISLYKYNVYRYRVGTMEQSMNIKNMQKNRKMHERVIRDLLEYYDEWNERGIKKEFLKYRIAEMEDRQIQIILSMPVSKVYKRELELFTEEMKENGKEIYEQIRGKKAKIIRKIGIRAYGMLAVWQHVKLYK